MYGRYWLTSLLPWHHSWHIRSAKKMVSLSFGLCVQPMRAWVQILKHFEMTAGLKVQVQGFQISPLIFSIKNTDLFRVIWTNFSLLFDSHTKIFYEHTETLPCWSPVLLCDLRKDSSFWKVDVSASSKCLRIRALDSSKFDTEPLSLTNTGTAEKVHTESNFATLASNRQ